MEESKERPVHKLIKALLLVFLFLVIFAPAIILGKNLDSSWARFLFALVVALLPLAFWLGNWMGKERVRGWLDGSSATLGQMASAYDKIDRVTERATKRARPDMYLQLPSVAPPMLPSKVDDVIDADTVIEL